MSLFKVYAHTSASSKTIQFKFTGTKSDRTVFAEPACYQPRLFEHPLRGLLGFLSLLSQQQLCCSDASHISLIIGLYLAFSSKKTPAFLKFPRKDASAYVTANAEKSAGTARPMWNGGRK
jgi:hypothetical protein